jgi:hypothetical protein
MECRLILRGVGMLRRLARVVIVAWFGVPLLHAQTLAPEEEKDAGKATPEKWGLHAQTTLAYQYHPAFTSPYQGPNSLTPAAQGKETVDLTVYAGVRLWQEAEFWVNPEIDQGFGLSDTLGVAGFPSGEAYKVGANQPYVRVHRAFLRQTINLGGPDDGGRSGPQPARRNAIGQPDRDHGWQIFGRRHLRHQRLCARPAQ